MEVWQRTSNILPTLTSKNKQNKDPAELNNRTTKMDSPKLKNISIRIKRQPRTLESMDEAREQVAVKRCTVRLQRYNDEELRRMAMVGATPLKDNITNPKNLTKHMVVRVRRLIHPDVIMVQ